MKSIILQLFISSAWAWSVTVLHGRYFDGVKLYAFIKGGCIALPWAKLIVLLFVVYEYHGIYDW